MECFLKSKDYVTFPSGTFILKQKQTKRRSIPLHDFHDRHHVIQHPRSEYHHTASGQQTASPLPEVEH